MSDVQGKVTQALADLRAGEAGAEDRFASLVIEELRHKAAHLFRGEPVGHTSQATVVADEAYMRLRSSVLNNEGIDTRKYMAMAVDAMRNVLRDMARGRRALVRDHSRKASLEDCLVVDFDGQLVEYLDLDDAIEELARLNERPAKVIVLRYYGGHTVKEIAEVLGLSKTAVEGDQRIARAWLRNRLKGWEETGAGSPPCQP